MLPASVVPHGEDQDVQQPIDPKARSEPQSAGTSRPLRAPLPPEAPDEQVILSFHLYFLGLPLPSQHGKDACTHNHIIFILSCSNAKIQATLRAVQSKSDQALAKESEAGDDTGNANTARESASTEDAEDSVLRSGTAEDEQDLAQDGAGGIERSASENTDDLHPDATHIRVARSLKPGPTGLSGR